MMRGQATVVMWHLLGELNFEVPQVGTLRIPWDEVLVSKVGVDIP